MSRVLVFLAVGLLAAPAHGRAQMFRFTPEERQAIMDYQLTTSQADHLIAAQGEVTRYLVARPDYKERVAKLRGAMLAAKTGVSQGLIASPANIEFVKAHAIELKPKMEAADGMSRPQ